MSNSVPGLAFGPYPVKKLDNSDVYLYYLSCWKPGEGSFKFEIPEELTPYLMDHIDREVVFGIHPEDISDGTPMLRWAKLPG